MVLLRGSGLNLQYVLDGGWNLFPLRTAFTPKCGVERESQGLEKRRKEKKIK